MVEPMENIKQANCSTKKQPSSPHFPSSDPQNHVRVIVAEDDPTWAKLLLRELRHDGIVAIWAANFEMARKLLENTSFDLLILDINLGDKTHLGRVLIQLLRKLDLQIPVIVISAILEDDSNELTELMLEPLVFRIIFKQHFDLREFQELVQGFTHGKRYRGQATTERGCPRARNDGPQHGNQSKSQMLRLATGTLLAVLVFAITIGLLTWVSQQVPRHMIFWMGGLGVSFDLIISTFILVVGGVISKRQAMALFNKLLEKKPIKPFRNNP